MTIFKVIFTCWDGHRSVSYTLCSTTDREQAESALSFLTPHFEGHLSLVEETTTVTTRTLIYA